MLILLPIIALTKLTLAQSVDDDAASAWAVRGECDSGNCVDPIDQAIQTANLTKSSGPGKADGLRKFKQQRNVIMWLQSDPEFRRFSEYGCYCLPIRNNGFGRGEPVDDIDLSCKVQQGCYECAQLSDETKDTCSGQTRYNMNFDFDAGLGQADVSGHGLTCTDPWTSQGGNKKTHCKRAICECDKGLAIKFQRHSDDWSNANSGHHLFGSSFNRGSCAASLALPNVGGDTLECCGRFDDEGNAFPFHSNSGQRSCCGGKTYDTGLHQCCDAATSTVAINGGC